SLKPDYAAMSEWYRKWCRGVSPQLQTAWMRAAMRRDFPHADPTPMKFGEKPIMKNDVVVAAPGCWDLLHDGHIATLRWAKSQGTKLIVLINTDEGVMLQKGN